MHAGRVDNGFRFGYIKCGLSLAYLEILNRLLEAVVYTERETSVVDI